MTAVARALFLAIALMMATALIEAQSCPVACKPASNGKLGPNTSTVAIGFASGFSAKTLLHL